MCRPRPYKMTVDRLSDDNYMEYWGTDWMTEFLDGIIHYFVQQFWSSLGEGRDPGITEQEWTIRCLTDNHAILRRQVLVPANVAVEMNNADADRAAEQNQ